MATLYITEFEHLAANYGLAQIAQMPEVASQTVAVGGTSTQSSAFNARTRLISVRTDAICSIKIATNPTATTSDLRMAANGVEYFGVTPLDKIAVISNT